MSGWCTGVSGGGSLGCPGGEGSAGGWTGSSGGVCCIVYLLEPPNDCALARLPRVAERPILAIGRAFRTAARVAELVDALDLGSSIERCGGSSPSARTIAMRSQ